MDMRSWGAAHPAAQDLSKAPNFLFGPLAVDPPLRRVGAHGRFETLEPRVMRVLVALVEAQGTVLSRDDLVMLCWDGVVVGDNAINRVISRLRRVLADLTGDEVRLETITKVGFRLVGGSPAAEAAKTHASEPDLRAAPDQRPAPRTRRFVLAGITVLGIGGVGASLWQRERLLEYQPDPRAVDLYTRAQAMQKTAAPGVLEQAMGFYKQAVAIDPEYADAWGALAIGYVQLRDGFSERQNEAYRELLLSAARRALSLDPSQAEAEAALVFADPVYRRLGDVEAGLRQIVARHPEYWFGVALLAIVLREGGRIRESIGYARHLIDEIDPMLPVAWARLADAYALAGDLQMSDLVIAEAARRWPAHGVVWAQHFTTLLETRRFVEAAAVARDPRGRPDYVPGADAVERAELAEALAAEDSLAMERIHENLLRQIGEDPTLGASKAPVLALLGAKDAAFAALNAYYDIVETSRDYARVSSTVVLFRRPMLALHKDPRHAALLERTGLEDYWRQTGSQPDFRRAQF